MADYADGSGLGLETALALAVDAGLDRVVQKTGDGDAELRAQYEGLKAPILSRLVSMENEQAFEISFSSPEASSAFAEAFNEGAPRTDQFIYGAVADGSVLSLKRMEPIGFIVKDGKTVRI